MITAIRKNTVGITTNGTVKLIGSGPNTCARIAAPEELAKSVPNAICHPLIGFCARGLVVEAINNLPSLDSWLASVCLPDQSRGLTSISRWRQRQVSKS